MVKRGSLVGLLGMCLAGTVGCAAGSAGGGNARTPRVRSALYAVQAWSLPGRAVPGFAAPVQLAGNPREGWWIATGPGASGPLPVLWHWQPGGRTTAAALPAAVTGLANPMPGLLWVAAVSGRRPVLIRWSHGHLRTLDWPVPAPLLGNDGGLGPLAGEITAAQGRIWVTGARIVQAPSVGAPAAPGAQGPLFHPVFAEIAPDGAVIRSQILTGLTVGGITALSRAADGSLWFGVSTGPYWYAYQRYAGAPALVRWNPSTDALQVFPLPAFGRDRYVSQLAVRGHMVLFSLSLGWNAQGAGLPGHLRSFDWITGQWGRLPGAATDSILAWSAGTNPGSPVTAVSDLTRNSATRLTSGSRVIGTLPPGWTVVGVRQAQADLWAVVVGPGSAGKGPKAYLLWLRHRPGGGG